MITDLEIKQAIDADIEQFSREMEEAATNRDAATDPRERAYWSTRYNNRSNEVAAMKRSRDKYFPEVESS